MSKETPRPNAKNATKSALSKPLLLVLGVIFIAFIAGVTIGWADINQQPQTHLSQQSYIQSVSFQNGAEFTKTETVISSEDRARGLSGRAELTDNQAMLFVFEEPGRPRFWMKDMKVAIDIIWLDCAGRIVDITPNVTPDTYPQTFKPDQPVQFILEVKAGAAYARGLEINEQAYFTTEKNGEWLGC